MTKFINSSRTGFGIGENHTLTKHTAKTGLRPKFLLKINILKGGYSTTPTPLPQTLPMAPEILKIKSMVNKGQNIQPMAKA